MTMQKKCQHCQADFPIYEEDLAFYQKIAPSFGGTRFPIPAPKLCPECRQQRRLSFRNERQLYRRKCDVTGINLISVFSPESPHKVCEKTHWYSQAFDPFACSREYDFNVPFFIQFQKLALSVPLPALRVELSENCDYNIDMRGCSNCYLCSRTHESQNMLYTYRGNRSNDCVDCTQVTRCSFLYHAVECVRCSDSRFMFFCTGCSNSAFLYDCHQCFDCFMCCNLRKKQYCYFNKQLSKEEYLEKISAIDFGSWQTVEKAWGMYQKLKRRAVMRNLLISSCENATGDNLLNCRNMHQCFGAQECSDGRYLYDVKLHRDAMDEYSGARNSELMYETTSGSGSYDVQFCLRASDSRHIRYSFFITACSDLFGCVGLNRVKYCVLNKQYSKEDYEALLPRIVRHMQQTGEWGEFFPAFVSPFAYNETAAHEHFPLTRSRATELGYRWLPEQPRSSKDSAYQFPDLIDEVREDVLKHPLLCRTCERNYKIAAQELAFYQKFRLALPRDCPDCRHLSRLHEKNPFRLREGICARCQVKFQTTFPADSEVLVYCEKCYLEEVS